MIHVVHGADTYRSQQKLQHLIKEQEREQERQSLLFFNMLEQDISLLMQEIEGRSLFDDRKTIVIKDVLASKQADTLVNYFSEFKKDNQFFEHAILFYVQEDLATLARSKKTKKTLKEHAKALIKIGTEHHIKPLSDAERPKWLMKESVRRFRTVLHDWVAAILAKESKDSWYLMTHIHRLAALSEFTTITRSIYDQYGAKAQDGGPDRAIFPLLDALAQDNKTQALALIDEQFKKDPASEFYLLTMFLYQFRIMLTVKDLLDRGYADSQMKEALAVHPFVIKKSRAVVQHYDRTHLKKMFNTLLMMHDDLKFSATPARIQLERFVLEL